MNVFVKIIQGALIGAGGVLPGVSGGVLAVLFGVYKPLMRLLAHPIRELKNTIVELWPILVGFVIGYIGIAKVLSSVLEAYQSESLAVFVGMAIGIMPSLFREAGEQGRNRFSWISLAGVFAAAFTLLYVCNYVLALRIVPNFGWNMFGGACLALSIIAPGMSASVLMLPLKTVTEAGTEGVLYDHITGAIGDLNVGALLPILLGAVLAFILLTRAVDWMMNKHYSVMFHGVIGLVIAATIFTIPFAAFTAGVSSCMIHVALVVVGCICTLLLDVFNSKVEKPPVQD
ncbi:MAG: DUF368 domain-containing protein [Clostridiales bacterium]|nr:DUF368 domain-containing protein [Clostridiales bacterium]